MTNKLLAEKQRSPHHICNFRHARRRLSVEALSELSPRSASSWKSFQSGAHKPQDGRNEKKHTQGRRERQKRATPASSATSRYSQLLSADPAPAKRPAQIRTPAWLPSQRGAVERRQRPGLPARPYRLPPGCLLIRAIDKKRLYGEVVVRTAGRKSTARRHAHFLRICPASRHGAGPQRLPRASSRFRPSGAVAAAGGLASLGSASARPSGPLRLSGPLVRSAHLASLAKTRRAPPARAARVPSRVAPCWSPHVARKSKARASPS